MSANGNQSLAALAEWYYEVYDLGDDLDSGDHLELVRRAFISSDCGDFAYALHLMTGWPVHQMGLHAFVVAPDGRPLDVTGWTSFDEIRTRYGLKAGTGSDELPDPMMAVGLTVDLEGWVEGYNAALARAVSAVRALPHAPFTEDWFLTLSQAPIAGVDAPCSDA